MRKIHDRIPVILKVQDVEAWLDPGAVQSGVLEMLASYPDDLMKACPVSSYVTATGISPECVVKLNPESLMCQDFLSNPH